MPTILKQSTQIKVRIGPFVDVGDGFTPETAVTLTGGGDNADEAELLKANGVATVDISTATWAAVAGADGWYDLTLTTSHTDTVGELLVVVQNDSVHLPVHARFQVVEESIYDALYAASAAGFDANQRVDVGSWLGTAVTLGSGAPDVNIQSIDANAITAAAINADAITAAKIADGAIDAATFAAGAIDAAAIATGAIDADALAADAATELRSLVSGTADSGSTTTLVDAARTEADTDYWKGCWLLVTSGTAANQVRLITGFTPASDTITFAPALTQAITTNTYEILPAGAVDLRLWNGTAPNNLVAGAVDSDVSAMQSNTITAAAIANAAIDAATFAAGAIDAAAIGTGAIDADAIATDAITAAKIAANAIGASELATDAIGDAQIATGAIASTAFAAGAINAAAIAADAIGASELATDAVNEIRDAIQAASITLPGQTAPPLSPTYDQAIGWLYKVMRNRKRQTSTTWELMADNETTVDAKATVSDDGTTAIKQEIVTGP